MKALVIGTAKSVWVKEFIRNVLLPEGIEVTLLSDPTVKNEFKEFYESNGVEYIGEYCPSPILSKIPKVKNYYKRGNTLKSIRREKKYFDLIFIISVGPFYVKCAKSIYQNGSKVYALFIGSDILRIKHKKANFIMTQLSMMKAQVVGLGKKTEAACNKYLLDNMKPVLCIDFGSAQLDGIDSYIDKGRNYCKCALNLDPNLYSICIGHNGFSSQQHLRIIDAIEALPQDIKERISIILPLTYGGKKKYIDEVKKASGKLNHIVLDSFMDTETVSILRVATDIYVNAQITDALSTSMLEHIYAGSKVIIGAWLSYPEIEEWGVKVEEFSDTSPCAKILEISELF